MCQKSVGSLGGGGAVMLWLSSRFASIIDLMLLGKGEVEPSAKLGCEPAMIRFGGIARVLAISNHPMPSKISEDPIAR